MRRLAKYLIAMAAAVIAFSGCQKETPESLPVEEGTKTVTLIADQPSTRTEIAMIGSEYHVNWTGNENTYFYADHNYQDWNNVTKKAVSVPGSTNKLELTISNLPANTKKITGFVGASRHFDSQVPSGKDFPVEAFGIHLTSHQAITNSTFDASADALVLTPVDVSNTSGTATLNAEFNRIFAISKLTFSGLEFYKEDMVNIVRFESKNNDLVGGVTVNPETAKFVSIEDVNTEITSGSLITNHPGRIIEMAYETPCKLGSSDFAAWMVTVPVDFNGDEITITIETDQRTITKTIKPSGKNEVLATQPNVIEISMSGATATTKVQYDYTEVTSVDQINTTDEYLLATPDYYIFNGKTSSKQLKTLQGATCEGTNITNVPDGVQPLKFVGNETDGFYIKFADAEQYISAEFAKSKAFKLVGKEEALLWVFDKYENLNGISGWKIFSKNSILKKEGGESEQVIIYNYKRNEFLNTYAMSQSTTDRYYPKLIKRTIKNQ